MENINTRTFLCWLPDIMHLWYLLFCLLSLILFINKHSFLHQDSDSYKVETVKLSLLSSTLFLIFTTPWIPSVLVLQLLLCYILLANTYKAMHHYTVQSSSCTFFFHSHDLVVCHFNCHFNCACSLYIYCSTWLSKSLTSLILYPIVGWRF